MILELYWYHSIDFFSGSQAALYSRVQHHHGQQGFTYEDVRHFCAKLGAFRLSYVKGELRVGRYVSAFDQKTFFAENRDSFTNNDI